MMVACLASYSVCDWVGLDMVLYCVACFCVVVNCAELC